MWVTLLSLDVDRPWKILVIKSVPCFKHSYIDNVGIDNVRYFTLFGFLLIQQFFEGSTHSRKESQLMSFVEMMQ